MVEDGFDEHDLGEVGAVTAAAVVLEERCGEVAHAPLVGRAQHSCESAAGTREGVAHSGRRRAESRNAIR